MTALRIALFTYSTKPRGSVIHTLELATALHHQGHSVWVYALDKDGQGFDRPLPCQSQLVLAKPAPTAIDVLIRQRIQEFVTALGTISEPYDIYHAQDCISANALIEWRSQKSLPLSPPRLIRTVHHIESFNSPYLRYCQERSIREVDHCFCVSQDWQRVLQQDYHITAARIINGVDRDRFSRPGSGDRPWQAPKGQIGTPVYLTVGGIEPRKNSLNLLRAFAQVRKTHPQAQLVIAGGATLFDYQAYRQEFLTLAEQLDSELGEFLILPGVIADAEMPALYHSADAFVFPSIQEGWGLVVLEAIAAGLPVLTANQPPFTEFLSPHQALLVDPHDPGAIAQGMGQLVDPAIAASLITHSQSLLADYTWDKSAQMHVQYYQQWR